MNNNKLTVFDLFSGGGGFRQGAEKAGMKIVIHSEINKWAEKFYSQAFDTKEELYFNDATKIDTETLPDFDVLLAGFPCQAFSIAGKRQGFKDARGTLFFDVARILSDKRPRYFILENVKGLLSHDGGKTFQKILEILTDIGAYTVEWQLLNSKYFGVPQNRERIFIVGYPRRCGFGKIFPIGKTDEFYFKERKDTEKIHNIASTLKARDYADWNGNFVKVGTLRTHKDGKGFREISDNTCPCILARAREDGSDQPVIYQTLRGNNSYRRLTPLECFRLQGFSDEVVQKGRVDVSDAQLYKIAGNSVTVNVVYEICKRIVELESEVL